MSEIRNIDGGVLMTGDAVHLHQAAVMKKALEMYNKHGMLVNRGYTMPNVLATCKKLMGKKVEYKNTLKGRTQCIADLEVWTATLLAATNVVDEKKGK